MIYICIPAHNEDRTIGVLLWKVRQVLANFPRDYQILVADDASTDATAEVLGPYERVLPLVVYRNTERKGYASSLEMLLREATRRSEYPKRDVVVTLQADFTEDPESIVPMLKRIEAGADVVTGETSLPENTLPRSYRWARRAMRYFAGRRTLPEGVTDAASGLRVYRVLVLKKAFDAREGGRLTTWDGWAANAELLLQLQPHSRRTEALPVEFRPERLQRATRFDFWGTLKQAWGLSRGRPGPLATVALPPTDLRGSGATHAQGRGRHGTQQLERVSNGGGQRAHGNGQRGRRNGRDGEELRGRDTRESRPRRTREGQERPDAQQRRPRRDGQEVRPGRDQRPTQEVRPGQDVRAEQEGRPQEARPRREGQRPRRERAERPAEQRPAEALATETSAAEPVVQEAGVPVPDGVATEGSTQAAPRKRRRRRRSSAAKNAQAGVAQSEMFEPAPGVLEEAGDAEAASGTSEGGEHGAAGAEGEPAKKRRRSRGRRGGRGRSRRTTDGENAAEQSAESEPEQVQSVAEAPPPAPQINEGSL